MSTLDDAIANGQGTERPFRCTVHEDNQASATVNVLKGVWFCHACHASGHVDGKKKAPKVEELQAMLEPEKTVRVYPQAYLELFRTPGYWLDRFDPWTCHAMGLGEDPFTGDATFPVHTPGGLLAGVGRRRVTEDKHSRYYYPRHWSASMTVFGTNGRYPTLPVLTLVEGAADASSLWEVGAPALAVYGSGVHLPQRDLLVRYNPKLILLGFDMDEAGELATTRAFSALGRLAKLARVRWPAKDPGDCTQGERRLALQNAVRASGYGVEQTPIWDRTIEQIQQSYQDYLQESH